MTFGGVKEIIEKMRCSTEEQYLEIAELYLETHFDNDGKDIPPHLQDSSH